MACPELAETGWDKCLKIGTKSMFGPILLDNRHESADCGPATCMMQIYYGHW